MSAGTELRQCEAWDVVRTEDDAVYVRCTTVGLEILERDPLGHVRRRVACPYHRSESDTRAC